MKIIKLIQKLFCKIGWHSFGYNLIETDKYKGIANKYQCKWCKYIGMVDSQGNLF